MKNIKKLICAALAAVVAFAAIPAQTTSAATYAELQAKGKTLAESTSNAKKEIEKLKDKQLSLEDEMSVLDEGLKNMQYFWIRKVILNLYITFKLVATAILQ